MGILSWRSRFQYYLVPVFLLMLCIYSFVTHFDRNIGTHFDRKIGGGGGGGGGRGLKDKGGLSDLGTKILQKYKKKKLS